MTPARHLDASRLDLLVAAVFTAALAFAPILGWGTPGDHAELSIPVGIAVALLAVVVRARNAASVDLIGVPGAAALAAGLALLPTLGGFNPALLLPLVAGYVLGVRGGFAYGVAVGAASVAAGMAWGPWAPYQVLGCAWLGALGGVAAFAVHRAPGIRARVSLGAAALAGGYLYGIFLNATTWSGLFSGAWSRGWGAGVPFPVGLAHFAVFYCSTALLWDTLRGLGLVILAIVLPWTLLLRVPLGWRVPARATA